MRRKDRKIKDIDKIIEIIKKCEVCGLALSDKDYPYIIPLNFGYEYNDEKKNYLCISMEQSLGKK